MKLARDYLSHVNWHDIYPPYILISFTACLWVADYDRHENRSQRTRETLLCGQKYTNGGFRIAQESKSSAWKVYDFVLANEKSRFCVPVFENIYEMFTACLGKPCTARDVIWIAMGILHLAEEKADTLSMTKYFCQWKPGYFSAAKQWGVRLI